MIVAIAAIVAAAAMSPFVTPRLGRSAGWAWAAVPASVTVWLASHLSFVAGGGVLERVVPWVPALGVDFAFRLDGLSLTFALMICGIGTAIVVYAGGYLGHDRQVPRFYLLLFAFMASMLGLVLSDDVLTAFVFWEGTSITSYFLVGYKHEREDSRDSAMQALLITGTGGLAMLGGFLLLGHDLGTFRISEIVSDPGAITSAPSYLPAFALIALGAFTKSAQFPFHVWLPNAMAAPTPVSAYLHSATMVKAGVYLLARLSPGFSGTPEWTWTLTVVGSATVVAAASLAVVQRDAKRLLAYSTLIALGALVMLLGVSGTYGAKAMIVFMVAHALYKAPLFMVAGNVDHEAGSRDVRTLRGLGRAMPVSWAIAAVAGVSAAGLPPLLGFVAKEVAYETLLGTPWALVALVGASIVMIGIVVQVAWRPFAGREVVAPKTPHEAPPSMWIGPAALAVLGVAFGLAPDVLAQGLLVAAASNVVGTPISFHLSLWHGVNAALILSVVTVAGGALLAWQWSRLASHATAVAKRLPFGPAWAYGATLRATDRWVGWVARVTQPRDVRLHVTVVTATLVTLVGGTLATRRDLPWALQAPVGTPYEYAILVVVVLAALATVRSRSRLEAVTALGVVGFGIALVFTFFSAPDLAITQFLVETLVVILVAMVLMRLPRSRLRTEAKPAVRAVALPLAVAAGTLVTALLALVTSLPANATLTTFFAENAYLAANGKNVVNVILVDFRALDTLGEITVLAVAATGAYALLRRVVRRGSDESDVAGSSSGPRGVEEGTP